MVRMYVRHPVKDYGTWRKAYDDFDEERTSMGVVDDAVYRSVDDRNDVTVYHDFETLDDARAFSSSERLLEVMSEAGVAGDPQVWFVEED